MQQMLSQVPTLIVRLSALTVILIILSFGLISWFLKYPKVVRKQVLFTVNAVPRAGSNFVGSITFERAASEKFEVGHHVEVALDNHPATEFVMLHGIIDKVSALPGKNNELLVQVSFEKGNQNLYLESTVPCQRMRGTAIFTVRDVRLLDILFDKSRILASRS